MRVFQYSGCCARAVLHAQLRLKRPEPRTLNPFSGEEDTVKVTFGLSRKSVDFFKREARRNYTAYQKMIRRPLDVYASCHVMKMFQHDEF
jgi:hypothetical protein